jgi:hypothetical protein
MPQLWWAAGRCLTRGGVHVDRMRIQPPTPQALKRQQMFITAASLLALDSIHCTTHVAIEASIVTLLVAWIGTTKAAARQVH